MSIFNICKNIDSEVNKNTLNLILNLWNVKIKFETLSFEDE